MCSPETPMYFSKFPFNEFVSAAFTEIEKYISAENPTVLLDILRALLPKVYVGSSGAVFKDDSESISAVSIVKH